MISFVVSIVSIVIAVISYVETHWERERRTTLDAAEELLTDRAQWARSVVRRAARADTLSDEGYREFTDAVFTLLWAIQRARFSTRIIKRTSIAPNEATWLYQQLDVMVPDIAKAMHKHEKPETEWGQSLDDADNVIKRLPQEIKGDFNKHHYTKQHGTIKEQKRKLEGGDHA